MVTEAKDSWSVVIHPQSRRIVRVNRTFKYTKYSIYYLNNSKALFALKNSTVIISYIAMTRQDTDVKHTRTQVNKMKRRKTNS